MVECVERLRDVKVLHAGPEKKRREALPKVPSLLGENREALNSVAFDLGLLLMQFVVIGGESVLACWIHYHHLTLLNRVKRIRGQVDSIERILEEEGECSAVLHNIATCRGAMDSVMAEVIEGQIRFHIVDPASHPSDEQEQAADDLVDALRAYLK